MSHTLHPLPLMDELTDTVDRPADDRVKIVNPRYLITSGANEPTDLDL